MYGEVGSTARMATRRSSARSAPTSAPASVDLPTPGAPVIPTVAATTGDVSAVWAAVEEHDAWARSSGARDAKRRARLLAEVESLAAERFKLAVADALAADPALVTDLTERRVDPYRAAAALADRTSS